MSEIYWITRLDSIYCIGVWMIILSLVTFVVCWGISVATDDWTGEDCCSENQKRRLRNAANHSIITFIIGILIATFVPTEREALMIYGIGGTIDYIKSNEKVKELPDKVVDALTRYIDSIEKKEE